jgi:hypothetical protein
VSEEYVVETVCPKGNIDDDDDGGGDEAEVEKKIVMMVMIRPCGDDDDAALPPSYIPRMYFSIFLSYFPLSPVVL